MLQNAHITSDDNILQHRAVRNVDGFTLVDNNNDSALQRHISAEVNVTCDGQVIQFQDLRHMWDSLLEVVHLFEV